MPALVELEVLDGLVPAVVEELADRAPHLRVVGTDATSVRARSGGDTGPDRWVPLAGLRLAVAAYAVLGVDATSPRALLGDEHLRRIVATVDQVRRTGRFTGFRLSAAGRDTPVLRRFTDELAARTGLAHDPDGGDLLLRVRKARFADRGWEVLVRLTPRPLSARSWRRADYPGALNATVAAFMVARSRPGPDDRVLNPMCGSGTLVIERLAAGPAAEVAACDVEPDALAATRTNLGGARIRRPVELWEADATDLTARVPGPAFDRVLVDLPWGDLVGSHEANAVLYPAFLDEMARVTVPGGLLVVATHEVRLFADLLRRAPAWEALDETRVFHKGHHPRIHVLRRSRRTGTGDR